MLGKEVPTEMPETWALGSRVGLTAALWQSFLEARKNVLGKKLLMSVK